MIRHALRRRTMLGAALLAAVTSVSSVALAQEPSDEVVIMQWQGGTDLAMWREVEARFMELHPNIKIREFLPAAVQGDARSGMRTALMGGEVVDIIINTWPAFREELAQQGVLRPLDGQWTSYKWDEKLAPRWKELGSIDGVPYGLTYTYGDRSGIWYNTAHLKKAGLTEPKTWEEFLGSFPKLKEAGYPYPAVISAKVWQHAEWFESLLLRTAGPEAMAQLAAHEIPWTDPKVKAAVMKYKEMLDAGCCAPAPTMLATESSYAPIFTANEGSYLLLGMWTNGRLKNDFKLKEGTDFSLFQFPALGLGFDDTSIVDAKELLVTANGQNPDAADVFVDFMIGPDAADIMAKYGNASPSSAMDKSLLGPVQQIAVAAVEASKVQFVLGDMLPGDLVDEYRVQLQKILQDPSEATIDAALAAIEAKAAVSY